MVQRASPLDSVRVRQLPGVSCPAVMLNDPGQNGEGVGLLVNGYELTRWMQRGKGL